MKIDAIRESERVSRLPFCVKPDRRAPPVALNSAGLSNLIEKRIAAPSSATLRRIERARRRRGHGDAPARSIQRRRGRGHGR
jgi:hypothetical protein